MGLHANSGSERRDCGPRRAVQQAACGLPRAYYPRGVPIPPDNRFDERDPSDADTGPLELPTPSANDGWSPGSDTWASRFEAPLTVSPKPVRSNRLPTIVLGVGGFVLVLVVGTLIYWLVHPSDDGSAEPATNTTPSTTSALAAPNADTKALLRLVPVGYPAGACEPVEAPKGALAQVICGDNADAGGPPTATYTLTGDKASLDATFNDLVAAATRVNCPATFSHPVHGAAMRRRRRPAVCCSAASKTIVRRSCGPMRRESWSAPYKPVRRARTSTSCTPGGHPTRDSRYGAGAGGTVVVVTGVDGAMAGIPWLPAGSGACSLPAGSGVPWLPAAIGVP
jgi:hypothetical protein